MGPIDYMGQYPQFDLAQKFTSGLQAGAAVGELDQQQQARTLALQQAAQYKVDAQAAMANPTPQNFAALALKYPTQREAIKQSWDGLSAADQKAEGDTMAQAYSALLAGQTDVAKKVVQSQIDARKNSGLDTSHYDNALSLLDTDPKQAQGALGFALSHISDPKTFAASFGTLQEVPGKVADAGATVAGKQADNLLKNQQVTGQKASALAKVPGLKPAQVQTFLQSEAAAGRIAPDDLATLKSSIPTDSAALPGFLNSLVAGGMTPKDSTSFVLPTAGEALQAKTSKYATDSVARTAAARLKFDSDQADDADQPGKPNEALAQRIAAYKQPPLGQFAMNKPWGQATMDRVAELNPDYDVAQYAPRAAALRSFAPGGKDSATIEATNTAMNHLATLKDLALAQKNGDTRAWNKVANAWASATGQAAPTNLKMAVQMVAPEVVKAVSGVGGTGEDRKHAADALSGDGTYSPDQVLGAVGTTQELFAGRLREKKRSYERGTSLKNFETMLSPAAARLLAPSGGDAPTAAPSHPADITALLSKYGVK